MPATAPPKSNAPIARRDAAKRCLAAQVEGQRGRRDGGEDGEQRASGLVGDADGKPHRQQTNEVHGGNAESHRHAAPAEPGHLIAATARADAPRERERGVGGYGGNEHRGRDLGEVEARVRSWSWSMVLEHDLVSVGCSGGRLTAINASICKVPCHDGRLGRVVTPDPPGAESGTLYPTPMSVPHYDLAVIGSGPAGQKGAIAAAKLRKRVAVIDRRDMVGGCSLHLGTIPSKTMREAILYLIGIRQRTFYGADYRAKENISALDLSQRVDVVLQREIDVVKAQLKRNGVTTINGMARFTDANTIEIEAADGTSTTITADTILIACGTRPAENPLIVTDGQRVFNSDQLLHLPLIPRELIVVGGGVIGLEYAAMMTALGTRVTLIDQRPTLLDFADHEIIESLCHHLREEGVTFRLGEQVTSVTTRER